MKVNSEHTVGENRNFSQWCVEKGKTEEIVSYGKQIIFFMCISLKATFAYFENHAEYSSDLFFKSMQIVCRAGRNC